MDLVRCTYEFECTYVARDRCVERPRVTSGKRLWRNRWIATLLYTEQRLYSCCCTSLGILLHEPGKCPSSEDCECKKITEPKPTHACRSQTHLRTCLARLHKAKSPSGRFLVKHRIWRLKFAIQNLMRKICFRGRQEDCLTSYSSKGLKCGPYKQRGVDNSESGIAMPAVYNLVYPHPDGYTVQILNPCWDSS